MDKYRWSTARGIERNPIYSGTDYVGYMETTHMAEKATDGLNLLEDMRKEFGLCATSIRVILTSEIHGLEEHDKVLAAAQRLKRKMDPDHPFKDAFLSSMARAMVAFNPGMTVEGIIRIL